MDGENGGLERDYDLSRLQGEPGPEAGPAAGVLAQSPRPGCLQGVLGTLKLDSSLVLALWPLPGYSARHPFI